jgi:hypothetical protein
MNRPQRDCECVAQACAHDAEKLEVSVLEIWEDGHRESIDADRHEKSVSQTMVCIMNAA